MLAHELFKEKNPLSFAVRYVEFALLGISKAVADPLPLFGWWSSMTQLLLNPVKEAVADSTWVVNSVCFLCVVDNLT